MDPSVNQLPDQEPATINEPHDTDECNNVASPIQPKPNNYQFESNRKYFSICIYALFVILVGSFIVYCVLNMDKTKASIQNMFQVLSPFIVAFFIAYILNPIVHTIKHFLEKILRVRHKGIVKALSIILTYLLVISLVTITLVYVIPELSTSVGELSGTIKNLVTDISNFLNNYGQNYLDIDLITEKLNEVTSEIVTYATNMVTNLVPAVISLSFTIVKVTINLLLSIVISIYMLNDKKIIAHNLLRALYAIFPKEKVDNSRQALKDCNAIFSNFIIGKSLDSLIIGLICFIVMTILKLPYALLLSVIVGLTNMIPYFGPFIGAIPGVVIYLVIDPVKAVIFGIMILALQQFDGLILGPKILGNSTGLKPLWVIFAITVGGAYYGVLGMFLGVPVVGVIAYLLNLWIKQRLKKKNIEE